MLIPRENDMVRFAIQISESDVSVNPETGRINRTKIGAERIMEVSSMAVYRESELET
jgi:hypothetical protein